MISIYFFIGINDFHNQYFDICFCFFTHNSHEIFHQLKKDPDYIQLSDKDKEDAENNLREYYEEFAEETDKYKIHGNYMIMTPHDVDEDDDYLIPSVYINLDGNKKIVIDGMLFNCTDSALKAYFS